MFVKAHILDAPYSVDKEYEYSVPAEYVGSVARGSVVGVPFGASNKSVRAVVFGVSDECSYPSPKPLSSVNCEVKVSEEILRLSLFLKDQTFCTVGDVLKSAVPFYALGKLTDTYSVIPGTNTDGLGKKESDVFSYISKNGGGATLVRLKKEFGDGVSSVLNSLCSAKILKKETEIGGSGAKYEKFVRLRVSVEEGREKLSSLRGAKLKNVFSALLDSGGKIPESELKGLTGCDSSQIRSLCLKGLCEIERLDVYRDPYSEKNGGEKDAGVLSKEQTEAYETISSLIDTGEAKAALLHGVTGSGKTRVIKSVIDKVVKNGRQAIVLVPEISLTPQTVGIFKGYYGDRVAVLHSSLSDGERFDAYRKICAGEVDVCIGTRSAVFAPFSRLGLIVIDEEQEHTYKSEMSPRYHARDAARFRAAFNKCVMLLSSATPSFESYYRAKCGIYTLVELKERYGKAELPEPVTVDMHTDRPQTSGITSVGQTLYSTLRETLAKKEQAILFMNRRGYHNLITCIDCGSPLVCPRCSVSMTFHSPGRVFADEGEDERSARIKNGWLSCHYCGTRTKVPDKCPSCGGGHFQFLGSGTQKAEEELRTLFPEARIMRMDADTTSAKFAYDDILDRFRKGEADILLGTQMVTKGHDFPNVTCVGILSADTSLYMDDYRANERTFDLVTQCLGRAGRAEKKGKAVIQTYSPDHTTLKYAAAQDYKGFYENEILLRKAYVFPPFCDVLVITQTSYSESDLLSSSVALSSMIREKVRGEYRDVKLTVFGPFEAAVYRVNDRYRVQTVVKCRSDSRTRKMFSEIYSECEKQFGKKITLSFDMDPAVV